MRSILAASVVLFVFALVGCGDGLPAPDESQMVDPAEGFASGIRDEANALIELGRTDPSSVKEEAEVFLESLEDTSPAGKYSETIDQIKAKVTDLATGKGKASDLAALVAQLPADEADDGGGELDQE